MKIRLKTYTIIAAAFLVTACHKNQPESDPTRGELPSVFQKTKVAMININHKNIAVN